MRHVMSAVDLRSGSTLRWWKLEKLDVPIIARKDDLRPRKSIDRSRRRHPAISHRWRPHLSTGMIGIWLLLGERVIGLLLRVIWRWTRSKWWLTGRRWVHELSIWSGDWGVDTRWRRVGEQARYVASRDDLNQVTRLDMVNFNECRLESDNVGVLQC